MNEIFEMESFGMVAAGALMLVYLLVIGLCIAQYVMFSLGLYDTARKRNIPYAWTAWIPVIGYWMLGAVADHYAVRRGGKRRWGKVMLIISCIIVAAYVLFFVASVVGSVAAVLADEVDGVAAAVIWVAGMVLSYLALILSCLAYMPCQAVCLYKVYEELMPEKAVKYLLLSYLVPLARGLCLLRCGRVSVETVPVGIEAAAAEDFIPQDPFAKSDTEE